MSESAKNRTTPLIASVCYVRYAVSEPLACARFVSDIFGLQQVADRDGQLAFRSDDRYRTVSLNSDQGDGASSASRSGMKLRCKRLASDCTSTALP